ncbi:MAG: NAD(P)-binding domain-containing protein [Segetibacter sp.]
MKIGILGTGMVGNTIGSKLIQLGHEVKMGSRTATNEKATVWVKANGTNATQGTFADAASFGETIFNCTAGGVSMEALKAAGTENLDGKILIDVANPLDFSNGMPPSLIPGLINTTSLGEEIQKAFPRLKVVKTLNTMNCNLMVDASLLKGDHDVFICGDDNDAKTKVKEVLKWFGWQSLIDLGDISASRGTEMLLPVWLRLYSALHSSTFNFKIVK